MIKNELNSRFYYIIYVYIVYFSLLLMTASCHQKVTMNVDKLRNPKDLTAENVIVFLNKSMMINDKTTPGEMFKRMLSSSPPNFNWSSFWISLKDNQNLTHWIYKQYPSHYYQLANRGLRCMAGVNLSSSLFSHFLFQNILFINL